MNLEIKECQSGHLLQVMDIEELSFGEHSYEADIFLSFLGSPLFVVALSEAHVVGYAMATEDGLIVSLAVHPDHRRQGIGKALVEYIISALKPNGVWLTHRVSNYEASIFYSELGFEYHRTIKDYYGDEDGIMLVKPDDKQ